MNLLTLLFRADVVVVVTTPQTAIINNQSVVTSPSCSATRNNQLTGPAFKVGTFQVTVGYTGPVGKLVV
jgi:hypothetical protein